MTAINYFVVDFDPIGDGTFGTVHRATDTRTNCTVALKRIKEKSQEIKRMATQELKNMQSLPKHPNILEALSSFEHKEFLWLVLEHCNCDLQDYLKENEDLSIAMQVDKMLQSSCGIGFLHKQQPPVVHRDIKLRNFLIKKKGDREVVKVCDFGLARFLSKESMMAAFKGRQMLGTLAGSPPYMAPEFSAELEKGLRYDCTADVFSLGLVYQQILDPNRPDYYPLSVEARRAKEDVNIGYQMVYCHKKGDKMPTVIETKPTDDLIVQRLKRIVRNMCQFRSTDRKNIREVEEELSEIMLTLQQAEAATANTADLQHRIKEAGLTDSALEPKSNVGVRPRNQARTIRPQLTMAGRSDVDFAMVVAIKIESSSSSYAFSLKSSPEDITMNRIWGNSVGMKAYHVPNSLLIDKSGKLVDFGFDAESKYAESLEDGEGSSDMLMFKSFPVFLYTEGKVAIDAKISSVCGTLMPALDIFTLFIRFMKDHLLYSYNRILEMAPQASDIRWVLTVPAIWSDDARRLIRRAAFQAGCMNRLDSEMLMVADMHESAAMYCRRLDIAHYEESAASISFASGTKFLLMICESKTVDVSMHEIQSNQKVKEVLPTSGGPRGSDAVDNEFVKFVESIIGSNFIQAFKKGNPSTWLTFMLDLKRKIESLDLERKSRLMVPLPYIMASLFADMNSGKKHRKADKGIPNRGSGICKRNSGYQI